MIAIEIEIESVNLSDEYQYRIKLPVVHGSIVETELSKESTCNPKFIKNMLYIEETDSRINQTTKSEYLDFTGNIY
jgi:hypothetical protein